MKNKHRINEMLTQRSRPTGPILSFEALVAAHEEIKEDLESIEGQLDEVDADYAVLDEARADTQQLVDAAEQMQRSNSAVAHEAFQMLLDRNLAKWGWTSPSMENEDAATAPAEPKEETAKSTEANKGLMKRMAIAIRDFFKRIVDFIKNLFSRQKQQAEVAVQTAQKAETVVQEAKAKPEVAQAMAAASQAKAADAPAPGEKAEGAPKVVPAPGATPPPHMSNGPTDGMIAIQIKNTTLVGTQGGAGALRALAGFSLSSAAGSGAYLMALVEAFEHYVAAYQQNPNTDGLQELGKLNDSIAKALSHLPKGNPINHSAMNVRTYANEHAIMLNDMYGVRIAFSPPSEEKMRKSPQMTGHHFSQNLIVSPVMENSRGPNEASHIQVVGKIAEFDGVVKAGVAVGSAMQRWYESVATYAPRMEKLAARLEQLDKVWEGSAKASDGTMMFWGVSEGMGHRLAHIYRYHAKLLEAAAAPYLTINQELVRLHGHG